MSDLISRRDAMMEARPEYLNPNQKGHEEYNKAWNDGVKAYWNGLKELPSELEWIPCSERLPDKADEYLCIDKDGDYEVGLWHPRLKHFFFNSCSEIGKPIAWMELPEPYKEQTERSE